MDRKLFAHIFNDHTLLGSVALQGHRFAVTSAYLSGYINQPHIKETLPSEVLHLTEACTALIQYEEKIQAITEAHDLDNLAQGLVKQILSLSEKQFILLPGGWSGQPGHAMVYQFYRDEENNLFFSIHNSGAGLAYHPRSSHPSKEKYDAVLTYKISSDQLHDQQYLAFILKEILRPQVPLLHQADTVYDARHLYQDVFPLWHALDAALLASETAAEAKCSTGGQISGTCTQRSLHQMLKQVFPTQDAYRCFMYDFKFHALSEYYAQTQRSGEILDPAVYVQIEKAIFHTLKLLDLKSTAKGEPHLFAPEKIAKDTACMQAWLVEIDEIKQTPAKSEVLLAAEDPSSPVLTEEDLSPPLIQPFDFEHREERPTPISLLSEEGKTPYVGASFYEDLNQIKQAILKASSDGQHHAVCELVTYFFNTVPLPDDALFAASEQYYAGCTNHADILRFLEDLLYIQQVYTSSMQALVGPNVILPQMVLFKLNIYAILSHITFNIPQFSAYPNQVAMKVDRLLSRADEMSFLANYHPARDARLRQLKTLFSKKIEAVDLVVYYQSLLDAHPEMKAQLGATYHQSRVSDPTLDTLLKQHDAQALYVLFEQMRQSEADAASHDAIFEVFKIQQALEKNYAFDLSRTEFFALTYQKRAEGEVLVAVSPMYYEQIDFLGYYQKLFVSIFDFSPSALPYYTQHYAAQCTMAPFRPNANDVQLMKTKSFRYFVPVGVGGTDEVSEDLIENRALFHLKGNLPTQILLTLNYYQKNTHKLSQPEHQKNLEANIFQPGLLLKLLSSEQKDTFFESLDQLIKKAMKCFDSECRVTEHSVMLIQIQSLAVQYAYEQTHDVALFEKHLDTLNQWVNTNTEDKAIHATLHRIRFEFCVLSSAFSKRALSAHFDLLLTSYFQFKGNDMHLTWYDASQSFRTAHAAFVFSAYLLRNPELVKKNLPQLSKIPQSMRLMHPEAAVTISGDFPVYTVTDQTDTFELQVIDGLVYQGQFVLGRTPIAILHHPIFEQTGYTCDLTSEQSADGRLFQVKAEGELFRLIRSSNGFNVQKQFLMDGEKVWYQLVANTKYQAEKFYHIDEASCIEFSADFPDILKACDQHTWVHHDGGDFKVLITDSTLTPIYRSEIDGSNGMRFSLCTGDGLLLSQDAAVIQKLKAFESSRFILATASTLSGAIDIQLPRYNLRLRQDAAGEPIIFAWSGRELHLSSQPFVIGEGVAPLQFEDEKGQVVLFPIQPFIASGDARSDGYYLLTPDTDAVLLERRKQVVDQKEDALWQYHQTAGYMMLKIRDGAPYPENAAQALFLCYQYLATHQAEKAFSVLADCEKRLGGFAGTYEELQYLGWIVNQLPAFMPTQSHQVQLKTPDVVAVQLKALSLACQFKSQQDGFQKAAPLQIAAEFNVGYHHALQQQAQDFEVHLSAHIYDLFSFYQKTRRELPDALILSMRDRKSLLDFYYDRQDRKALGALGYEWVQLSFEYLKQEFNQLRAKEAAHVLTKTEKERLTALSKMSRTHLGVDAHSSQLIYQPIRLCALTTELVQNRHAHNARLYLRQHSVFEGFEQADTEQIVLERLLVSDVDELDLLQQLKPLLQIANDKTHALHQRLKLLSKSMIIWHRHVDLAQQSDNKALVFQILYAVCCAERPLVFHPSRPKNIDALIEFTQTVQVEPIAIPEFAGVSKLLTRATPLWKNAQGQIPGAAPQILPDIVAPIDLIDRLTVEGLDLHCKKMRDLLTHVDHAADSAGDAKLMRLEALKSTAATFLTEIDLKALSSALSVLKKQFDSQLDAIEAHTLEIVHRGPLDEAERTYWSLDKLAKNKKPLDMPRLVTLYLETDVVRYQAVTGIADASTINALHTHIAQYLNLATAAQQVKRVLDLMSSEHFEASRHTYALPLARLLFSENLVCVIDEPALAVLQYVENILIYAPQKAILGRLLHKKQSGLFDEVVEKLIMGGGKSKVIAPLVAKQKADGSNLVMIEVPPPLLRTNFIDLQATSSRLFDQRAFLFEFYRESDCSPRYLKSLYNRLQNVIVRKDYIITTGISLQALELKYFELLHDKPRCPDDADAVTVARATEYWQDQIMGLQQLLQLFKNQGDLLIDEVHQGLLLKKKLNFTLGGRRSIPKSMIGHVVDFFKFLKETALFDAIQSRVTREAAMADLVSQLCHHPKSPLAKWIARVERDHPESKCLLEAYFWNQSEAIPAFVMDAPNLIREQLALYKQQVTYMLPYTLSRKHGEHYGPSQNTEASPVHRACAIPYLANNVPSETSRFGNILETINYTIQSLFHQGLSRDMLKIILEEWLIESKQLVFSGSYDALDNTPYAAMLKEMMQDEGFLLSSINLEDDACIDLIHGQLKHHEMIIFEVLKTKILPTLKTDAEVLHHDAYHHVEMVRTCQGMSGTPWNDTTYHQRLSDAKHPSRDGYVLDAIAAKKPVIRVCDFKDTASYLDALLSAYTATDQLRALIDVSASFKGVDNLVVAKAIAVYIQNHPMQFSLPEPVQYILFFNRANELSALDINRLDAAPIVIGGSSESVIQDCLHVGPDALFTFYSQAHTVGVDIKQSVHAKALVMVDHDTHIQSFEQGALRMRGLIEGEQTVDVVVPTALAEKNFGTLCAEMHANEEHQLKTDNFYAAIAQMKNRIREDLKERIYAETAVDKKHDLLKQFQSFFITETQYCLFTQYGHIEKTLPTDEILYRIKESLIKAWVNTLADSEVELLPATKALLTLDMNTIFKKYTQPGMCHPTQTDQSREHLEVQILLEVEVKQEVQYDVLDKSLTPFRFSRDAYLHATPLIDYMPAGDDGYCVDLSEDLLVSPNFIQTYNSQTRYLDAYLKPVFSILWEALPNGGVKATLLSQQEVITEFKKNQWIGTTQHTVLAGNPLENYAEHPSYQLLIEQIRYFNGEFQLMLDQTLPYYWIDKAFQKKINYFCQFLLSTRETAQQALFALKSALFSEVLVFQYIVDRASIDLTATDWHKLFPDAEFEDTTMFTSLAEAFVYIYANRHDAAALQAVDFADQFNLDFRAVGFVRSYLEKREKYQLLLNDILAYHASAPEMTLCEYLVSHQGQLIKQYFPKLLVVTPQKADDLLVLSSVFHFIPEAVLPHETLLIRLIELGDTSEALLGPMQALCKKNPALIPSFLKANHVLPSAWFDALLHLAEDEASIMMFAEHPQLTLAHLPSLFNQAKQSEPEVHVMERLQLPEGEVIPIEVLKQCLTNYKMNNREVNLLLGRFYDFENMPPNCALLQSVYYALPGDKEITTFVVSAIRQFERYGLKPFESILYEKEECLLYLLLLRRVSEKLLNEIAIFTKKREHYQKVLERAKTTEVLNTLFDSPLRAPEDTAIFAEKAALSETQLLVLLHEQPAMQSSETLFALLAHEHSGHQVAQMILTAEGCSATLQQALRALYEAKSYEAVVAIFKRKQNLMPSQYQIIFELEGATLSALEGLKTDYAWPQARILDVVASHSVCLHEYIQEHELTLEALTRLLESKHVNASTITLLLEKYDFTIENQAYLLAIAGAMKKKVVLARAFLEQMTAKQSTAQLQSAPSGHEVDLDDAEPVSLQELEVALDGGREMLINSILNIYLESEQPSVRAYALGHIKQHVLMQLAPLICQAKLLGVFKASELDAQMADIVSIDTGNEAVTRYQETIKAATERSQAKLLTLVVEIRAQFTELEASKKGAPHCLLGTDKLIAECDCFLGGFDFSFSPEQFSEARDCLSKKLKTILLTIKQHNPVFLPRKLRELRDNLQKVSQLLSELQSKGEDYVGPMHSSLSFFDADADAGAAAASPGADEGSDPAASADSDGISL